MTKTATWSTKVTSPGDSWELSAGDHSEVARESGECYTTFTHDLSPTTFHVLAINVARDIL